MVFWLATHTKPRKKGALHSAFKIYAVNISQHILVVENESCPEFDVCKRIYNISQRPTRSYIDMHKYSMYIPLRAICEPANNANALFILFWSKPREPIKDSHTNSHRMCSLAHCVRGFDLQAMKSPTWRLWEKSKTYILHICMYISHRGCVHSWSR